MGMGKSMEVKSIIEWEGYMRKRDKCRHPTRYGKGGIRGVECD